MRIGSLPALNEPCLNATGVALLVSNPMPHTVAPQPHPIAAVAHRRGEGILLGLNRSAMIGETAALLR